MSRAGGNRVSKTFRAASAKEVLSRIGRELGPDAVIIAHGKAPGLAGEVWAEASAFHPEGRFSRRAAYRAAVPIVFGLVVLIVAVGGWRLLNGRRAASGVPAKLTAAVVGFEDNTGNGSHASLSQVIPNLLITHLEQSGFFDIVPWERMQNLLEQADLGKPGETGPDLLIRLCRKDGIDVLVMGSYAKAGETFATDVKVLDVKTRKVRASASSHGIGEGSILSSQVDELGREILQGFGFFSPGKIGPLVQIADITTDSMDAYYHYLRGREYYSNENYKDARIFLQKAVLLDPHFAVAHLYFASALSASGERRVALEVLEKAVSLADRATEKERLLIRGMAVLIRPGDFEEGARIFKDMIRRYPNDKDGHYGLGIIFIMQGRYEASVSELQKALALDPYDGKTLGMIAMAYLNKEDFERALFYFDRQIAASPKNARARNQMAGIYLNIGNLEKALAKCEEAFEADPDQRLFAFVAYIFALAEDYERALRLMNQIVQVEGFRYFEKSLFNYWAGRFRQAEGDLRRLTDYAVAAHDRQSEANALWSSGWLAYDRGEYDRAEAFFVAWLDVYRQDSLPEKDGADIVGAYRLAWFSFYLGLVDIQRGRIEAARARLVEIASQRPNTSSEYRDWVAYYGNFLEAEIALADGDPEGALRAIDRRPLSARDSGLSLLETGARPSSRGYWFLNVPFYRDVRARAYRMKNDLDGAIAEYERLIANNRQEGDLYLVHPRFYFRLAELYERKAMIPDAVRRYERFLDLWKNADTDIPEIGEARRRLARLRGGA